MTAREHVRDLLDFIDASPSPWHAVATIEQRLQASQFQRIQESDSWSLVPGGRYYVIRDDSSIAAFAIGKQDLAETGFKILGAHTDSPSLRVKPQPVLDSDKLLRLAVEVYGGPILATFTDRDLSLAGRVAYQESDGRIASRLLRFDEPLLRLPNLAIHMNRGVNEDGLKLKKQAELPLIFSASVEQQLPADRFKQLLERASGIATEQILSWELNVYDTQKGAFWGDDQLFYADSQLDNLASCHAGLSALLDDNALNSGNTLVCAFFDHEEIGSESCKGAAGSFLPDVLERIANSIGNKPDDFRRALANSFMVSADMAHAYHPNFPSSYEPGHKVIVNQGPVIKVNVNHRYASECVSEATFIRICQQAEVPYQKYAHHGDLPCGSTIGPIASAKLGIRSVDVGSPMWAMHSLRESAGVLDHLYMIQALRGFFSSR
ncbi:M18 family aminopeptidase [Methylomonas montana]|uniref:M18 family aminopeptidase n=1 Tax=Methylomonas montana TaxID=3058963 RepID=UPI0026589A53|nr:M18 family aminopeptidase [Methylomonas montana]WKJ89653.1 M18 family aminopeptidase [Methylomonas montana]